MNTGRLKERIKALEQREYQQMIEYLSSKILKGSRPFKPLPNDIIIVRIE